jgi:fido (protein-threonine AMPylation protein)
LRNLLGITTKNEIDRVETELLFEITDQLLDEFDENRRFSVDDIFQIHRRWLGSVYEWAGTYRRVMMSRRVGCLPFFSKYSLIRVFAAIPSIAEDEHTETTSPESRFALSRKVWICLA